MNNQDLIIDTSHGENARIFAQEQLILDFTESMWEALEKKNMKKQDLARALGKSKSFVTQILSGSRNMTLRTLSDIAHVLDLEIHSPTIKKQENNIVTHVNFQDRVKVKVNRIDTFTSTNIILSNEYTRLEKFNERKEA